MELPKWSLAVWAGVAVIVLVVLAVVYGLFALTETGKATILWFQQNAVWFGVGGVMLIMFAVIVYLIYTRKKTANWIPKWVNLRESIDKPDGEMSEYCDSYLSAKSHHIDVAQIFPHNAYLYRGAFVRDDAREFTFMIGGTTGNRGVIIRNWAFRLSEKSIDILMESDISLDEALAKVRETEDNLRAAKERADGD